MKTLTLTLGFLVVGASVLASQQNDQHLERARRILAQIPLIDGHNDLPWAIREFQTAPRLQRGRPPSTKTIEELDGS